MNFDELVLEPIYTDPVISSPAEYIPSGGSMTGIRVIDLRDGVAVGNEVKGTAIRAAAAVRKSDVQADPTSHGLTIFQKDENGDAIPGSGVAYLIDSHLAKLNGNGVATGEFILFLKKV